jgi:ribosome biogenesis GTPase A
MMILGIPNVGKSTLMNTLLKRVVTKVGDEPAVTKSHLGHELGPGMWLVDTPGMLWPGVDQDTAQQLAATHSIGRNAYENVDVAAWLGAYLLADYRGLLTQRFGNVPEGCDGYALIASIARSRSLVVKGGAPDLERAARVLLSEFRNGTLGQITLETPAQIAARSAPAPEDPSTDTPRGDPNPLS